MFDPNKLKETLDSLRSNATMLRNKDGLGDVSVQALELLLLRSYADLDTCVNVISQLAQEKQTLKAQLSTDDEMAQNEPVQHDND